MKASMRWEEEGLSRVLLWLCPLLLCPLLSARAEPLIYQATGTREQIQPVVEQFKHDIIYGPGHDEQNPPPFLGSFRLATFDDLTVGSSKTLRKDFFDSGGIGFYSLLGANTLYLSAGTADPSNPDRLFGDINRKYPDWLQAYSSPSVLGVGGPEQASFSAYLKVPDLFNYRANAFGAVFADVDFPGSVWLSASAFSNEGDVTRLGGGGRFEAPAAPGDGNFSFLGVILDESEVMELPVVGVELPLLPWDPDLRSEDQAHGVVAMDDLIIGTAPPMPEPSTLLLVCVGGAFVCWITLRRSPTRV